MSYAGKIKAGSAYIEITTDNSKLLRGLAAAQTHLRTFGQSLKGVGADMMQVAGAISIPFILAGRSYAAFDDKIRTLRAISGATAGEIKSLQSYIRELGATTAFTSQQVAQGSIELARMGFSAFELKDAIRPVMDLVRATGEEMYRLGEISEFAASAMRVFQLPSSQIGDVCDVMAFSANRSSMNIADLGEALKIAGPSAYTCNEDLRDTAANLMLLANAGVKGSLAGTSLRKIYQSLAAVSGKIQDMTDEDLETAQNGIEQLRSMNIELVDPDTGNLRKAADVMYDMASRVRSMASGEKINFATDVFDLRGSLGALSMLNNAADMKEFRNSLSDVVGYSKKTAAEIEKGFGGMTRYTISRIQDMGISIGEAFYTSFEPWIKKIPKVFEVINNFIKANKHLVSSFVLITMFAFGAGASLFALGAIMKIMAAGLGVVIFAFRALAFTALLPVNAMILLNNALKIVGYGFGILVGTLKAFTTAAYAVTMVMGAMLGVVKISTALKAVKAAFGSATAASKIFRIVSTIGFIAIKVAIISTIGVLYALLGALLVVKGAWIGTVLGFKMLLSVSRAISWSFNLMRSVVMASAGAGVALKAFIVALPGMFAAARAAVVSFVSSGALLRVLMFVLHAGAVALVSGLQALKAAIVSLHLGAKALYALSVSYKAVWKGLCAGITYLKGSIISLKAVENSMKASTIFGSLFVAISAVALLSQGFDRLGKNFKSTYNMFASSLSVMKQDFITAFGTIKDTAMDAFGVIKTAMSSGDMAGAAKVALAALQVIWFEGIAPLRKAWAGLKQYLCDSWAVIKNSVLQIGNGLWYGLQIKLIKMSNFISNKWNSLWDGIVDVFEQTVMELQKAWIRTKGLFDSDEEVQAQIKIVEDQYNQRKSARETNRKQKSSQNESELAVLENKKTSKSKSIDKEMFDSLDANKKAYEDAVENSQKSIADVKANYEDSKAFAAQWTLMQKTASNLQQFYDDAQESYRLTGFNDDAASQNKIGDLKNLKKWNPNAADLAIRKAILEERKRIAEIKEEYDKAMEAAKADRVIDEGEQRALRLLAMKSGRALELKSVYESMLGNASEATGRSMKTLNSKVLGSWSSKDLTQMLGANSVQERTLKVAEKSVRYQEKMNRHLENIEMKPSLTYGA